MRLEDIGDFMRQCENFRTIELSESNRAIILSAFEMYRIVVTTRLYKSGEDHDDIELLEIDEIIEIIGSIS